MTIPIRRSADRTLPLPSSSCGWLLLPIFCAPFAFLFFFFFYQGDLVPGRLSQTSTVNTLTSDGKQLGNTQYYSDNLDWNTRLEYLFTCFNTSVNSVTCREASVQLRTRFPTLSDQCSKTPKLRFVLSTRASRTLLSTWNDNSIA